MNKKTLLAGASALTLASMGVMPLTALANAEASTDTVVTCNEQNAVVEEAATAPKPVIGTFSYTQDAMTSSAQLKSVFAKSAATLCQSLPNYACQEVATSLILSHPSTPEVQATVRGLIEENDGVSLTMACACATNAPGGGAVANAEVEGVLLQSIAAMMNL